ncbi:hypothetical protein Dimus_031283 [Dionaea muscipula]
MRRENAMIDILFIHCEDGGGWLSVAAIYDGEETNHGGNHAKEESNREGEIIPVCRSWKTTRPASKAWPCPEDALKALNEKAKEPEAPEPEPEPTTEVLFLCSYEGCGKTFIDAGR